MKLFLILCSACSLGAALVVLSSCAAPSGGGSGNKTNLPSFTKDTPFVNSLGMKFVPVPGTNILMCTTETTMAQYQVAGMANPAPRFFPQAGNHPVVHLKWEDAQAFCARLSQKEGRKYRLPTEAEWAAACGSALYPWGNAWPPPSGCDNYAGQELRGSTEKERSLLYPGFMIIGGFSDHHRLTAPVGSYPANYLGIHDLGGNVSEWCAGWYDGRRDSHVLRGGSWSSESRAGMMCSSRAHDAPGFVSASDRVALPSLRNLARGFRVVVER